MPLRMAIHERTNNRQASATELNEAYRNQIETRRFLRYWAKVEDEIYWMTRIAPSRPIDRSEL